MKLKKVWKNLLGSHQATSIYFVILSHRGVWNFVLFSLSKQGFVHQSNQESLTGYFQSIPEFPSMAGVHRLPRFCRSLFILSSKWCQLQLHTLHTHREHCAFLFLKNIPIAPKPKRDDHAIQAMSPYETNMHPNREQKNPRVYRDNFVVVVFKLDQNFCYPNQVGGKKKKTEKKKKYFFMDQNLFSCPFPGSSWGWPLLYIIFFSERNKTEKKLPCWTSFNHFKTPGFVKWNTLKPLGSGKGWASDLAPVPMHARCRPAPSLHQVCSAGLWMPKCCDVKNVLDWPIEYQYTQL